MTRIPRPKTKVIFARSIFTAQILINILMLGALCAATLPIAKRGNCCSDSWRNNPVILCVKGWNAYCLIAS